MRFHISRTSDPIFRDTPPCEEAFKAPYTSTDARTVDDPAKVTAERGRDWWYEKGTNHRVENGHIKRDFPAEGWFVEFATLEELLAFRAKYERLVLEPDYGDDAGLSIEIYDDYRE